MLGTTDYVVSARLGFETFDRRSDGRARARAVLAEARRIRRADHRVRSVRLRRVRGDRMGVMVDVVVRAPSGWAAYRCGSSVVRAALHAVGGTTAGWGGIEPVMIGDPGAWSVDGHGSWADASAAALRRLAAGPALPPIGLAEPAIVDLR